MGQSQASHSLQSITDPPQPPAPLQHPPIPGTGERKISFVLNDTESTESGEKVAQVSHVRLKHTFSFLLQLYHVVSFCINVVSTVLLNIIPI